MTQLRYEYRTNGTRPGQSRVSMLGYLRHFRLAPVLQRVAFPLSFSLAGPLSKIFLTRDSTVLHSDLFPPGKVYWVADALFVDSYANPRSRSVINGHRCQGRFPVTNPLTDLKPSSMSGLFTTVEIRGSLATSQLASIRLRTDGDDGQGAVTSTQPIPLELAGQKRSARGLESGANNGLR